MPIRGSRPPRLHDPSLPSRKRRLPEALFRSSGLRRVRVWGCIRSKAISKAEVVEHSRLAEGLRRALRTRTLGLQQGYTGKPLNVSPTRRSWAPAAAGVRSSAGIHHW